MMGIDSSAIRVCLDDAPSVLLNQYRRISALQTAHKHRSDGVDVQGLWEALFQMHAVGPNRDWFWKNGTELGVAFLDGDPTTQSRILETARQWCQFANIRFTAAPAADAQIRVSFWDSASSSSKIGRRALAVAAGKPTMQLQALAPDEDQAEYNRVVLHEFGHVLGLGHEHQSPASAIPWNEPVVYEYYEQEFGWSADEVKDQVLTRYSSGLSAYSRFDPRSIMIYAIPDSFVTDGKGTDWNYALSELDIQFIGERYPRPTTG